MYKIGNMTYSKRPLEGDEQKELVKQLELLKRKNIILEYYATNNENNTYKQDRKYAMIAEQKAKAMGKKKGVSDICIILKDKVIYIEMKRQKEVLKSGAISKAKDDTSKEQITFLENVNKSDVVFGFVGNGFNDAFKKLSAYL